MKKDDSNKPAGLPSGKKIIPFAAILGVVLIFLVVGFLRTSRQAQAGPAESSPPTPTPTMAGSTISSAVEPEYHKKALAFKRPLVEAEVTSIRSSALTEGYQALSSIPPAVMMPQGSIRIPQFPDTDMLSNYRALSTLGTQQYYSNVNVQQYLRDLSNQQWMNSLNTQQWANQQMVNNFNTQTYLSNMRNWQNTTVFNAQQYLNTLQTQQAWNNINNQQYLNNWNSFSNQTFRQPTFTQPTFSQPTFRQPTFIQPVMPSFPSYGFP